jgi:hypothetical protein
MLLTPMSAAAPADPGCCEDGCCDGSSSGSCGCGSGC